MTPLPGALGSGELRIWRLDQKKYASTWDSGEGSFQAGARWNSPGVRAVYAAADPATAILEVAVHKGFGVLDTRPHILTSARIIDPGDVMVIHPEDIANPNWLTPSVPGRNQQRFGDDLLSEYLFILIPSASSRHSWNVIFDPIAAAAHYDDVEQEIFALDPRLQP